MKKKYLKIMVTAIALISMSSTNLFAQFPEWSYANIGTDSVHWNGVDWGLMDADWADDFMADGKLTLDLDYYASFDMESQDVSDVWDLIETSAAAVDKYLEGDGLRAPDNADDFSAEIKGFYDDNDVYILIKATDDEIIPGAETMELMWASYADYLAKEDWPFTPRATVDNEHVIARWGSMGAGKAAATLDFVDTIPIVVEGGFYFNENDAGEWTHSWATPDWNEDLGMKVGQFKQTGNTTWEAIWKFNIDKTFGGLVTPATDLKFSFDFKIVDKDTLTQTADIQALFSSTKNEVWWSTYYAGYASFSEKTAINNKSVNTISAYPNPSNGNLFFSEKVAKIDVYSVLGSKVYEVNQLTNQISLTELNKGIYIVKTTDINNYSQSFRIALK